MPVYKIFEMDQAKLECIYYLIKPHISDAKNLLGVISSGSGESWCPFAAFTTFNMFSSDAFLLSLAHTWHWHSQICSLAAL